MRWSRSQPMGHFRKNGWCLERWSGDCLHILWPWLHSCMWRSLVNCILSNACLVATNCRNSLGSTCMQEVQSHCVFYACNCCKLIECATSSILTRQIVCTRPSHYYSAFCNLIGLHRSPNSCQEKCTSSPDHLCLALIEWLLEVGCPKS